MLEQEVFKNALNRLTLPKLKAVAQACGSALSGTKSQVIDQLHASVLQRTVSVSSPYRLISIDLGVKNIGVTHLLIPPLSTAMGMGEPSRPVAESCYRASLPEAKVYAYPEFADMAITFTSDLIANSKDAVDGVILERQRLHAASGNVPADVVKANLMEAMAFTALRVRAPELYLESVPPKNVLQFWKSADVSSDKKKTISANYQRAKQLRKTLLAGWLADPRRSPVDLGTMTFVPSSKGKSDDVADSLVQALTWSLWRRNSHLLVQNIEAGEDLRRGFHLPCQE